MSGSEVESVNSGSNNSEEEVLLFECKKCGQRCTAAEKDTHRATHKLQKRQRWVFFKQVTLSKSFICKYLK